MMLRRLEPVVMWTLGSAHAFLQELEMQFGNRYHVALTGGVLLRGESWHDLDIIVYPHTTAQCSHDEIRDGLVRVGCQLFRDTDAMRAGWSANGRGDTKHVEVWTHGARRIDVQLPYPDTRRAC